MVKRTSQGELLTGLILEVFRLNGSLLDAGNQITKPYGLTSAKWQVMGAIDVEDRPLTVSQIARRMGLTRQAVQRTVNELVKLDMVVVKPNLDHKRAPLVLLSNAGRDAMEAIDQTQFAWANELASDLSEGQLSQALQLLTTVRTRCERVPIQSTKET